MVGQDGKDQSINGFLVRIKWGLGVRRRTGMVMSQ